jgi:protein O-GlcNAc transferase
MKELMQPIEQGMMLHRQGRMAEAEAVYRSILARDARHFDALHMLGLVRFQNGAAGEAYELINSAVKLRPKSAQALSVLMAVLLALGRSEEALPVSDRLLRLDPNDADALYNRAIVFSRLRRFEESLGLLDKVLARNPGSIDALFERGNVLVALSRFEQAQDAYGSVLRIAPSHLGALTNRGNSLLELGRHDEALACYDRVLAINPNDLNALNNRAVALKELGRLEEGMASCERALRLDPRCAPALVTRGNIQLKLHRNEDALSSFDQALAFAPNDADVLNNRGFALTRLQRIDAALAAFDRAIALAPNHAGAIDNKGAALHAVGRFEEALASFDRAVALAPRQADILYHRGQALGNLLRYEEAIAALKQARAIDPKHFQALGALAFYQLTVCDWKEADLRAAELKQAVEAEAPDIEPFALMAYALPLADYLRHARRYGHFRMPGIVPFAPAALARVRRSTDKLRVAYLTSAFARHPTGWQIGDLIEAHDRSRFEVHAISYGLDDGSDIRARLVKAFDRFHDVVLRSDREIAQLLRELAIDIAVDLKGYTEKARPGILAYRPAPIQVSYLGYTATMGADFIDYILADKIVLPLDQQPHYSEKIVHLPDSYWPNDSKRQVAEETPQRRALGLPEKGFVLCCFNNTYKVTPDIFDRWMRLLRGVEDSVLWLLDTSELAKDNLRREAQSRGVAPERLVFAPRMEISQHLARHRAADLFLDNLPVNAHTGTSDALWMGVPVVTCVGEAFALKLAADHSLLADTRNKLEHNRLTTPLFNTDRLRFHIERAYERMWDILQRREPPTPIVIEPMQYP